METLNDSEGPERCLLPFIEVLLLLLIIADPGNALRATGVIDRLTVTEQVSEAPSTPAGVILVTAEGGLSLDGKPIKREELVQALKEKGSSGPKDSERVPQARTSGNKVDRPFILAVDKATRYDQGLSVRVALQKAGLNYVEVSREEEPKR